MGVFGVEKLRLGDNRLDDEPAIRVVDGPVGPVWVIADESLARQVFADPRIGKDTAFAPKGWGRWVLGLEPTGAEQPSLTGLDGEAHRALRKAHAPLFTTKVLQAGRGRIESIAREFLGALPDEVDLVSEFTVRFPLAVMCDKLGVPMEHVPALACACQRMVNSDIDQLVAAMGEFHRLVGQATAGELRARLPAGYGRAEADYVVGVLVFGGQTTTDGALGFVIAHLLAGHQDRADSVFVSDVLRKHPPFPYTLWRFTKTEVELGGQVLPARSPLLIHIEGLNARGGDFTFGTGPHFCVGAQLAQLELEAVVAVLKQDYPDARL